MAEMNAKLELWVIAKLHIESIGLDASNIGILFDELCDVVNKKLEEAAQTALSTGSEDVRVTYDPVDYPDALREAVAERIRKLKV
mgnify:CR=1 FL=1